MKKTCKLIEAWINSLCFSKKSLTLKATVLLIFFSVVQVMAVDSYSSKDTRITEKTPKTTLQQGTEIKGTITDENGEPLPGVNILIKGTSRGTVSNGDGNYTLEVSNSDAILAFSFVSYEDQEITVGNQTTININMVESAIGIEEVVTVGYGTQKKVNMTGAVGVAKGEVLENRPIVNVAEGLKGVIPNLNVTIRNGDPTRGVDFNIRGMESINGGYPLVLVDGVPMDMNKLNPNDIESISVLKDAAASAVYGARAAFGVILVKTKTGKIGKMNVTLSTEFSTAKPIMFIDPITDPYQFVMARNMASQRTNGADSYDQDYIDGTKAWSENPTDENAWGFTMDHFVFMDTMIIKTG